MKIVILDRKTLGYDIDVSVFEKFGSVISFDVTKPDETNYGELFYNNLSIDLQKEVTPPRIAHRRD